MIGFCDASSTDSCAAFSQRAAARFFLQQRNDDVVRFEDVHAIRVG